MCKYVAHCFSTGVPRNPWVFPRGSMELRNPWTPKGSGSLGPLVLSKIWATIDTISRLLVCPKCICGLGSIANPAGGAYSAPPDPLAGGEGAHCPLLKNPFPLSDFGLSGLRSSPRKYMGSVRREIRNCSKAPLHGKG